MNVLPSTKAGHEGYLVFLPQIRLILYSTVGPSETKMRIFVALSTLALLGLSACSSETPTADETEPSVEASTPEAEKKFVAATDEFGAGLEGVTSVAFWSHPSIVFNSVIVAGHADGISLFNIEDGAPIDSADGFNVIDLAVGYLGEGPQAVGYIAASTDDEANPVRFFQINNSDRSLQLLSTIFVAQSASDANLCLGRANKDDLILGRSRPQGTTVLPLKVSAAGVSSGGGFSSTTSSVDCAIDQSGKIFSINNDGDVVMVTKEETTIVAGGAVPAPSAVSVSVKSDETGSQQARLVILGSDDRAYLFSAEDGHALGAVGMRDTFDVVALEAVTSLAVGYGNYGGIYRDGALAFVDGNASGAPIKLAPWSGVVRELDLPLGQSVNPRGQVASLDDDESVISIDLVQP